MQYIRTEKKNAEKANKQAIKEAKYELDMQNRFKLIEEKLDHLNRADDRIKVLEDKVKVLDSRCNKDSYSTRNWFW